MGRHRWGGTSWGLALQSDQKKEGNKSGDAHVHPSILKVCEAAGWGSAHPSSCCRGSRALIPFFPTKIPVWEPALEGRTTVTVTPEQLELAAPRSWNISLDWEEQGAEELQRGEAAGT